jgi:hypothetical protein
MNIYDRLGAIPSYDSYKLYIVTYSESLTGHTLPTVQDERSFNCFIDVWHYCTSIRREHPACVLNIFKFCSAGNERKGFGYWSIACQDPRENRDLESSQVWRLGVQEHVVEPALRRLGAAIEAWIPVLDVVQAMSDEIDRTREDCAASVSRLPAIGEAYDLAIAPDDCRSSIAELTGMLMRAHEIFGTDWSPRILRSD